MQWQMSGNAHHPPPPQQQQLTHNQQQQHAQQQQPQPQPQLSQQFAPTPSRPPAYSAHSTHSVLSTTAPHGGLSSVSVSDFDGLHMPMALMDSSAMALPLHMDMDMDMEMDMSMPDDGGSSINGGYTPFLAHAQPSQQLQQQQQQQTSASTTPGSS